MELTRLEQIAAGADITPLTRKEASLKKAIARGIAEPSGGGSDGGGGVFVVPLTETEVPGPYGIGTETRLVNDTITYQDIYEAQKADKLVVAEIWKVGSGDGLLTPLVTDMDAYSLSFIEAREQAWGSQLDIEFSRHKNGNIEILSATYQAFSNTVALPLPVSIAVGYAPKYISLNASNGALSSDGVISDFVTAGERVGPQALPYVYEVTAQSGGAGNNSTFYQIVAINNIGFASYEVVIQNPATGTKYTSGTVASDSTTPLTFTEVQA